MPCIAGATASLWSANRVLPLPAFRSIGSSSSLYSRIISSSKLRYSLYSSIASISSTSRSFSKSRSSSSSSSQQAAVEEEDAAAASRSGGGGGGMAEAFGISRRTATAITVAVFATAAAAPAFMRVFAAAASGHARLLTLLTLLLGFYMAWNIGANDVANAMGTSVGSGALTLRRAVLVAALLEFAGAFTVGSHVSETMQKILLPGTFLGRDSLLFVGLISALAASGSWLQVASYCGWPVSTTHCIIGSLVGFGLAYGGVQAVYWTSLFRVVASWVISPALGGIMSFCVYKCIRTFVYSAPQPGLAATKVAPLAVFLSVTAFSLTALPFHGSRLVVAMEAVLCGVVGGAAIAWIIRRQLGDLIGEYCTIPSSSSSTGDTNRSSSTNNSISSSGSNSLLDSFLMSSQVDGPKGTQLTIVYAVFGYLQVLSACFMSFAHGANDVANAIGPIAGALSILNGGGAASASAAAPPVEILAWGGFGIVAGLLVWGYRVIATIGRKITELTPTRGFAAEFAAATVVVGASRMGLPISATHTLVGAVVGVGFARGLNSVRGETLREIVASWLVTIPVGAGLTVVYTLALRTVITSLV